MRDAETVLSIIRDRGSRGLPLEDVYRQLFNPGLYLLAYGKIARNAGAMTPGPTTETVDGMSQEKIATIIGSIREEKYRFAPARRVYIEKKNSVQPRPLGIPPWSDKLVQEVVRLILEAYYEPRFSDRSHGFRPGRGCHTALTEIYHTWTGTTWFIEGDIKGCFDSLDHGVLLDILRQDIRDNRFLRLIAGVLQAGYLEEWRYHHTLSGTPQGGVVSPILANISLDRLDQFVENVLIPEHTRGTTRKRNPAYTKLGRAQRRQWERGNLETVRVLRKQKTALPTGDPNDPNYRRLRYVRYADDFLLGFTGPREEAEEITHQLGEFLREQLKLELSADKTLITHGRTESARFLGYDIEVMQCDQRRTRTADGRVSRTISGHIGLRIPLAVPRDKSAFYRARGRPIHRKERTHDSVYSIVARYDSEFRGIADYYKLARNRYSLGHLKWIMETSLTKTLAHKLKISVREVYRRYGTTLQTARGPKKVLRVTVDRPGQDPLVATWGRSSLARDMNAVLNDDPQPIWNTRTELVERLLADTCELCGSTENVQVHHIKALKNLHRAGRKHKPTWVQVMAARHRKTLVVCEPCHRSIHAGRPTRSQNTATGDRRAG